MRKYFNIKSGGFDSKKEKKRDYELTQLLQSGEILTLERQVKYELIPKQDGERSTNYIADFRYTKKDGSIVVEDVKSNFTKKLPLYIIKRKLMLFIHGIKILES